MPRSDGMKIRADAISLRRAADRAKAAIARNAPGAPTNCLLLEADQTLTIDGTDLHLSVSATVAGAVISGTGAALVPAVPFAQFLSRVSGPVTVEVIDQEAVVRSGDTTLVLRLVPESDYPRLGPSTGDPVDVPGLIKALRRVAPFASADRLRSVSGLRLEPGRVVATDTHRLGIAAVAGLDLTALIPASVITHIGDLSEDTVTVSAGANHVAFAGDECRWRAQLIESPYPQLGSVARESSPHHITTDRGALIAALDRVASLGLDEGPHGRHLVTLQPDGRKLTIRAKRSDIGEVAAVVGCKTDVDIGIGFNGRYLAQVLKAHLSQDVTLGLVDACTPAVIHEPGFTSVLTPVRFSEPAGRQRTKSKGSTKSSEEPFARPGPGPSEEVRP